MTNKRAPLYSPLKRLLDIFASLILLVVTLPVQLGVAIAVCSHLGKPVLFRQQRPGRNGRLFTLYKFRSMLNADEGKALVTDEQRLSRFGKLLRATSLDELPSLWNVLRGDMSIVGPRPLLVEYLTLYTLDQARRHEVRPGITGLAQVKGRNSLSWAEKFELDVKYVDNLSFLLDSRICVQTVSVVFRQRGISSRGHVTMPKFGEDKAF